MWTDQILIFRLQKLCIWEEPALSYNSRPEIYFAEELIGWLNGVLRRFQQYFSHIMATVHIIHVFPGFHEY